jgi:Xaa-Pro dipeptidase
MSFPRDDARLLRVRALMAERELDALVVRTPDNIVYLTNFWGMKGYDACVFPREGEPVLICLEASEADAARTAWTSAVRLFPGYDPDDPRPPGLRALELAVQAAAGYRRVAIELSGGTQASDRMVGEPTTFSRGWFDAFPGADDATPLLVQARALKTPQEIERMRLANEIAASAMEHVRGELRPGMTCAQAAAVWHAYVHGEGTGWRGVIELALPFSLVWSGPSIRTFTATSSAPVREGEPTLFEIWVCADGYWADHTKNLVCGELDARYAELGFPGQPTHPICHGVGARAHEPPYAHQAADIEIREGMVLAIEPGCYWPEGGGLRVEDNFHVTAEGPDKLSPFPDGIVNVR